MFTESIETDRFVLRVPQSTDGAAVHDAVSDVIEQLRAWPESWPWALQEQSEAVSTAHCERARGHFEREQKWNLFVHDRETKQVIGNAEFHTLHAKLNIWELGFWTCTSQQHRGVMNEVLTALVEWMKENNPDIEILTRHDHKNVDSIKIVEKLGFRPVDEYQFKGITVKMYSSNPQGVE